MFERDLDIILKESHSCDDCKILVEQYRDDKKQERETTIKGLFCKEHQKLYNRWKRTLRLHLSKSESWVEDQ